jgi:hypothetical protein
MAEFEVPMTLRVEAENEMEAHLCTVFFEKIRDQFESDSGLRWLHASLSPTLTQAVVDNGHVEAVKID